MAFSNWNWNVTLITYHIIDRVSVHGLLRLNTNPILTYFDPVSFLWHHLSSHKSTLWCSSVAWLSSFTHRMKRHLSQQLTVAQTPITSELEISGNVFFNPTPSHSQLFIPTPAPRLCQVLFPFHSHSYRSFTTLQTGKASTQKHQTVMSNEVEQLENNGSH